MTKKDGGPAFPREDYQTDGSPGQSGMSLRAYIATHALAGLLANSAHNTTIAKDAELAIGAADALIAELDRE